MVTGSSSSRIKALIHKCRALAVLEMLASCNKELLMLKMVKSLGFRVQDAQELLEDAGDFGTRANSKKKRDCSLMRASLPRVPERKL